MRALFYSKVNLDQIFQGLRMSCLKLKYVFTFLISLNLNGKHYCQSTSSYPGACVWTDISEHCNNYRQQSNIQGPFC